MRGIDDRTQLVRKVGMVADERQADGCRRDERVQLNAGAARAVKAIGVHLLFEDLAQARGVFLDVPAPSSSQARRRPGQRRQARAHGGVVTA